MNKVIKILIVSDAFLLTSFGLINPILAIYFKEDLVGGSVFTAGLASTVYLFVKASVQLPFSKYVDAHGFEKRVHWLIIGSFLIAAVPFIYIFAQHIYMIFFAQLVYGVGSGFAYPAWLGIWSTHLDKRRESFEWSFYSTVTGLGTAVSASVGALLASSIGFNYTFLCSGILSVFGCLVLFELDRKNNKIKKLLKLNYHRRRKLVGGPYNI